MKQFLFATGNAGKLRDVNSFLSGTEIEVLSPAQYAKQSQLLSFEEEIEETGTTYEENSRIKSLTLFQWAGIPTLADDSGLEVEALGGDPGLYSARYAGENCSFDDNIQKLLSQIQNESNRRAKFVSVISLTTSLEETIFFRGELFGSITAEKRGDGGFGYDPVFEVEGTGKTLAELKTERNVEESHDITRLVTHRTKALQHFLEYLQKA